MIILTIVRSSIYLTVISGHSMSPALKDGDRLIILRRGVHYLLRCEQIIICDLSSEVRPQKIQGYSTDYVIKRIKGLPGNSLYFTETEINKNMKIYNLLELHGDKWRLDIPFGYCYLSADGIGADSKLWGLIPLSSIKGLMLCNIGRVADKKMWDANQRK